MPAPRGKYELLALSDEELMKECRFDAMRGTGPGGQKRNKTSSAARVTHLESGLSAFDDVTRSQHQNLKHALDKLRGEIAVNLLPGEGEPTPGIPIAPVPKPNSRNYFLWLGRIFDALLATDFQMPEAAARFECSPSHLIRIVAKDEFAWQKLAEARQRRKMTPLRQ